MANSMGMFIFSDFDWKYPFLGKFVSKNQYLLLRLKFKPRIIRILRIWWWLLFFSFVNQKYLFLVNLIQKFKIVSLNWNLVPRLFWICIIWWFCSLFLRSTLFCKFCPKTSFAILILHGKSPSSLITETWNERFFLLNAVWFLFYVLCYMINLPVVYSRYVFSLVYLTIIVRHLTTVKCHIKSHIFLYYCFLSHINC